MLTIEVPAGAGKPKRIHLLRELKGDFLVQIRVGGDFQSVPAGILRVHQVRAGLVVMTDENTCAELYKRSQSPDRGPGMSGIWCLGDGLQSAEELKGKETYLRLERKGNILSASLSEDGRKWTTFMPETLKLPARLKVGIFVRSGSTEPFTAKFDQLKLTLMNKKVR